MAMAIVSPLCPPFALRLPTFSLFRPRSSSPASCRIGFDGPLPPPDLPNLQPPSALQLKTSLTDALQGVNRGVFGVSNARKQQIEQLIESLEHINPVPRPTEHLEKVKGEWKLLYSTISILGSRRTKLGLRDFITLGDFLQQIDVDQNKSTNTVTFSVPGLGMLRGALIIEASYRVSSATRVDICFEKSSIVPDQLLKLFQKNYGVLLSIFNPEGWLEITYVDDNTRIGRDDKGNIFLLERTSQARS